MATRAERRKMARGKSADTAAPQNLKSGLDYLEQLDQLDEGQRHEVLSRAQVPIDGHPIDGHPIDGHPIDQAPGRPDTALRHDQPDEETEEEQLRKDARATLPATAPDPSPRMAQERLESRIKFGMDERTGKLWGPQPDGHNYCPKRPGTEAFGIWQTYLDGMTVSAFLAGWDGKGGRRRARSDMRWNLDHGYIWLQTAEEYAREQAEKRAAMWTESFLHEAPETLLHETANEEGTDD